MNAERFLPRARAIRWVHPGLKAVQGPNIAPVFFRVPVRARAGAGSVDLLKKKSPLRRKLADGVTASGRLYIADFLGGGTSRAATHYGRRRPAIRLQRQRLQSRPCVQRVCAQLVSIQLAAPFAWLVLVNRCAIRRLAPMDLCLRPKCCSGEQYHHNGFRYSSHLSFLFSNATLGGGGPKAVSELAPSKARDVLRALCFPPPSTRPGRQRTARQRTPCSARPSRA